MSVRLLGKAFYADLPTHLKITLLALCDEASEDGRGISIGQKKLAMKVGCVERSVRRNLDQLREQGWIVKLPTKHPRYHTDQYEIIVDALPERWVYRPDNMSAPDEEPDTDGIDDRTPSVESTGHPRPTTQELPVTTTQDQELALGVTKRHPVDHELALASFDNFWSIYPRKAGRAPAVKAWEKAIRKADPDTIIVGALLYLNDPNREDAYTAHASTWLNQERWNDDPLPARTKPRRVGQSIELLRQAVEG